MSIDDRDDEPRAQPRQKHRGKPVAFNQSALKDFVTGFHHRRQQRQQHGLEVAARKERLARQQARKERKEALNAEIQAATQQRKRKRQEAADDEDSCIAADPVHDNGAADERHSSSEEGDQDVKNDSVSASLLANRAWKYEDDAATVVVQTRRPTDADVRPAVDLQHIAPPVSSTVDASIAHSVSHPPSSSKKKPRLRAAHSHHHRKGPRMLSKAEKATGKRKRKKGQRR